jgi:hypothetical protein
MITCNGFKSGQVFSNSCSRNFTVCALRQDIPCDRHSNAANNIFMNAYLYINDLFMSGLYSCSFTAVWNIRLLHDFHDTKILSTQQYVPIDELYEWRWLRDCLSIIDLDKIEKDLSTKTLLRNCMLPYFLYKLVKAPKFHFNKKNSI